MKPFSVPTERKPLDRQAARDYLTTNLALPGFGSLAAKRISGYFQAPLCVLGLVLTTTFGVRFFVWYFTNHRLTDEMQDDPVAVLNEIWIHVRWALLGMALFALSWLWALATGLSLLHQAKADEQANRGDVPPRITNAPGKM